MGDAITTLDRADVRGRIERMSDDEVWADLGLLAQDVKEGRRSAEDMLRLEELQLALYARGQKAAWDLHYIIEWVNGGLL